MSGKKIISLIKNYCRSSNTGSFLTAQIPIFLTAPFPGSPANTSLLFIKGFCHSERNAAKRNAVKNLTFKLANFQITTLAHSQIDIYSSFFFLDKKEPKNQDWKLT
ncbi:hypothetical protein IV494_03005 [Kaistella sp. G5-32]|uniref:DRBM domain-containing protein n=1 Tax=Kaistella gelatinilytica TaxID=2787636 RepID=A0ABS0F8W7_9FLAO|nr:hypothetical protein [Kaistella gelatinilytica]MBF8456140.1 hypothetical protein [Kaistella gelatinilytica]